ncbi:MAG: PEP-CTERM sorting domain-containing protein [Bryobacterales bacterium]|nr:PEP-CTERM sorting domain-containing protein [Bryobacterales bacterium]
MRQAFVIVLFSLLLAGTGAGSVISTFDTDYEGWTVVGDGDDTSVQYFSTGGLPGGFIRRNDNTVSYMHFSAPAKFLGDLSRASYISYDLLQTVINNDDFWYYRVVVEGAGMMLLNQVQMPVNPNDWVHQVVYFQPTGWEVITHLGHTSGTAVTPEQFAAVLADVTGLHITGDLANTPVDIASLDNVNLVDSPEPSSVGLVLLGSVAILIGRRRRSC